MKEIAKISIGTFPKINEFASLALAESWYP